MNIDHETRRGPTGPGHPRRTPAALARPVLAPLLAALTLSGCGYSRIQELDELAQQAIQDHEKAQETQSILVEAHRAALDELVSLDELGAEAAVLV